MKCGVPYIVSFLKKLLEHDDRDAILQAIDEGISIKDSHRKGEAFEAEAEEIARGHGFLVEPGNGERATDKIINGWRVQIKHCDQVQSGGRVAINNMRPVKGNNYRRGYAVDEVDFVILKHRGAIYVMPSSRLIGADGNLASTVMPSQIETWRNAWDAMSERGPHGTGQKEFF